MHSAYAVGNPGLAQTLGGGAVRYDTFPVGQAQHHAAGAHVSYLTQPGLAPHIGYPNLAHQGAMHHVDFSQQLQQQQLQQQQLQQQQLQQQQQQNQRGGFVGPRRHHPNPSVSQYMSYQPQHDGSQVTIPGGADQANAYGTQVAPQNRPRGPMIVVPTSHASSFYPDHPRYSGGFTFKLFNDERTHFIHLPSQYVLVTEGSTRYLGSSKPEQMAPRFTLCRHVLRDRTCPRGSLCNFIHGVLHAAESDPAFRRIEVHKNDAMETGATRYELLPEGASMVVAYPGEDRTITIPSQNVYKTRGSDLYLRSLPECAPQKVPQRCTHYHFKKMCHRGAGCNFIHIAYDTGMLPQMHGGDMNGDAMVGAPGMNEA